MLFNRLHDSACADKISDRRLSITYMRIMTMVKIKVLNIMGFQFLK